MSEDDYIRRGELAEICERIGNRIAVDWKNDETNPMWRLASKLRRNPAPVPPGRDQLREASEAAMHELLHVDASMADRVATAQKVAVAIGHKWPPYEVDDDADESGNGEPPVAPLATVPRGCCGRCDRCGWPFKDGHAPPCSLGNCSMRPLPPPRSHCAGCGAAYKATGQDKPAARGSLWTTPACRTPLGAEARIDPTVTAEQLQAAVEKARGEHSAFFSQDGDTPHAPANEPPKMPKMPKRGPRWQKPWGRVSFRTFFNDNDKADAAAHAVVNFDAAIGAAEWHQRDAAQWRARAEEGATAIICGEWHRHDAVLRAEKAEARVAELDARLADATKHINGQDRDIADLEAQHRADRSRWQEHWNEQDQERAKITRERNAAASVSKQGVWVWSDTDPNELANMSEDMVVTMTAGRLRKLLAERERGDALPACVREWRNSAAGSRDVALTPLRRSVYAEHQAAVSAGEQCLEWLATATARDVARLALRGDALRAVREWQSRREKQNGMINAEAAELDSRELRKALLTATVLDADDLRELFAALKEENRHWIGDVDPKSLQGRWRSLMLRPEWRKLAEEP